MVGYPFGGLFTGVLLILAGGFTLGRHYLLEPICPNYPKAPFWLRNFMFLFAAVMVFLGLQFLWVFVSDAPNTIPPQPAPSMQLLSLALCLYQAAMLGNILRQRYPQEVWDRLNRINEKLFCKEDHPIWRWLSK
jgi:hypothetical protein